MMDLLKDLVWYLNHKAYAYEQLNVWQGIKKTNIKNKKLRQYH